MIKIELYGDLVQIFHESSVSCVKNRETVNEGDLKRSSSILSGLWRFDLDLESLLTGAEINLWQNEVPHDPQTQVHLQLTRLHRFLLLLPFCHVLSSTYSVILTLLYILTSCVPPSWPKSPRSFSSSVFLLPFAHCYVKQSCLVDSFYQFVTIMLDFLYLSSFPMWSVESGN